MKRKLLEQALSPIVLNSSWRRLKREHTPWSPAVSRQQLDWHLLRYILELRDDVLNGNYRAEPLRRFTLRKADGKKRILSAQYLRDKLLQRTLLTVLEPDAEALFHEDSFAYRPNRGVGKALARVNERVRCGLDWLVDADLQQFFDTIPHAPLKQKLRSFIRDKPTMKLMEQWLKQGCHHQSLLGKRQGISQGAVLSPLMCNIYLHSFDSALTKANIPFVRFADDFLLFASSKKKAEAALQYTEKLLTSLELRLHPDKTQVVRSHPRIRFLGESLPKSCR